MSRVLRRVISSEVFRECRVPNSLLRAFSNRTNAMQFDTAFLSQ